MSSFHIAELNVARARASLEDPAMDGFVSRLEEINAHAEGSPGFVWRLQTEDGNATSVRPFDDDQILINLSVWESIEDFLRFVYAGPHMELVRSGRDWFEPPTGPQIALWWIPAGELPALDDAQARLDQLRREGPSPRAFGIRDRVPPPKGGGRS